MRSFDTWYGVVSSYDSDHITIRAGLLSGTYRGHFSFDAYGNVYGQLTGYEVQYSGQTQLLASGLNVDANRVMDYVNYGDASLYNYLFARGDTFELSGGSDRVMSFSGNDLVKANGGNDWIDAGAGSDTVYGGTGVDTLIGGSGADRLIGGIGNDSYVVESAQDVIVESASQGVDQVQSTVTWTLQGNIENLKLLSTANINGTGNALANTITGNLGGNRLAGLAGNDRLAGLSGNDSLFGNAGRDAIEGGAGNDRLLGGSGADRLGGGMGADVFVFSTLADSTVAAPGRDTITDFQAAHDRIDLKAIDAIAAGAGNQAFTFIGSAAFSGEAGELASRAVVGGTLVLGDVNGDRVADIAVFLDDRLTLQADHFLL